MHRISWEGGVHCRFRKKQVNEKCSVFSFKRCFFGKRNPKFSFVLGCFFVKFLLFPKSFFWVWLFLPFRVSDLARKGKKGKNFCYFSLRSMVLPEKKAKLDQFFNLIHAEAEWYLQLKRNKKVNTTKTKLYASRFFFLSEANCSF